MKICIDVKGVISKEDVSEITEKESDELLDAILEVLENRNYMFAGGFALLTDDEYVEINNLED